MYKLTFFMEELPEDLETKLTPIGFKKLKDKLVFEAENQSFTISPFGDAYKSKVQGYRVQSDFSIDGILRIFDRAIGIFSPKVTAVEYLFDEDRTKEAWDFYFRSRPAYKIVDERGIFQRGNIGIFYGGIENKLHFSIRPSKPRGALSLNRCIEEIALLVEHIRPSNVDIFTYSAEEAI